MNVKMYSVFDRKVAAFAQPFYAVNDLVAMRCLKGVVSDHRSVIATNPADFDLFCVGEFNDDTGLVTAITPPVCVCNALNVSLDKEVNHG